MITTASTENVAFARELGADIVIYYKKHRFEDEASVLDIVFDLIDGETRERSWNLLKKGGILTTSLTDPSQDSARERGVRAARYTVALPMAMTNWPKSPAYKPPTKQRPALREL